ncbi:MAG: DUF4157 domain-containing protein [Anaerolineae bacterium]
MSKQRAISSAKDPRPQARRPRPAAAEHVNHTPVPIRAPEPGVSNGDPRQFTPSNLLALQPIIGNRAVTRLIQARRQADAAGGPAEKEQAQSGHAYEVGPEVASRIERSRGAGSPLPDPLRAQMESQMGADFGAVRLHTDVQADQLNREVSAQAFTHGADIYIGAGKYNPDSTDGKRLLAHELTHVVQQGSGEVRRQMIQRLVKTEEFIQGNDDPEENRVIFGVTALTDYNKLLKALTAYHTVLGQTTEYTKKTRKALKSSLADVKTAAQTVQKSARSKGKKARKGGNDKVYDAMVARLRGLLDLLRDIDAESNAIDTVWGNPSAYTGLAPAKAIDQARGEAQAAKEKAQMEEVAKKHEGQELPNIFGNTRKVEEGEIEWKEKISKDAPSLEGLEVNETEKFTEGESHISTYKTPEGHGLVGKIESSKAEGHLKKEMEAYRTIYDTVGPHKNLGKVHGMARVQYGKIRVEAMVMDEIPGMRGSVAMRALKTAWDEGQISSSEYWGAIQYIGRCMLDVIQHLKKAGLAHNDIKPDNFVVDERTGEPVVIDLGLHGKQMGATKGATKGYMAPEMMGQDDTPGIGSEKGDVFTVSSTLLAGVEGLNMSTERKPSAGISVRPQGAFTREGGSARHMPGIAGVKTAYTSFMDETMNPDPEERSDAEKAKQSEFLSQGSVDDGTARKVLIKVVGKQLVVKQKSGGTEPGGASRARKDEKLTLARNAVRDANRAFGGGTYGTVQTGNRALEILQQVGARIDEAEDAGADVSELREALTKFYGVARGQQKKAEATGAPSRDEEVRVTVKRANVTLTTGKQLLDRERGIADLPRTLTLIDQSELVLRMLPEPPPPRPKWFGREPRPLPEGTNEARTGIQKLLPELRNAKEELEREQVRLGRTAKELTQAPWYDTARAALTEFEKLNLIVKSGVDVQGARLTGEKAPKQDPAIQQGARKALADTLAIRDQMVEFEKQAHVFVQSLGAFPPEELTEARDELATRLSTVRRLLTLEQEWIGARENPEIDKGSSFEEARKRLGGQRTSRPEKVRLEAEQATIEGAGRWEKQGGKWQAKGGSEPVSQPESQLAPPPKSSPMREPSSGGTEPSQEKPTSQRKPPEPPKREKRKSSESRSLIDLALGQERLTRSPIDGDGNCFYMAVVDQLLRQGDRRYPDSQKLRDALALAVQSSKGDEVLSSIVKAHGTSLFRVADKIRTNRSWNGLAGDIAPELTANLLKRKIIIYHPGGTYELNPRSGATGNPLRIIYNGTDHYDSTSPMGV